MHFLISESLTSWSRNCYSHSAVFIEAAELAGGCYLPRAGSVEVGRVGLSFRHGRIAFAFTTLSLF